MTKKMLIIISLNRNITVAIAEFTAVVFKKVIPVTNQKIIEIKETLLARKLCLSDRLKIQLHFCMLNF
jgi:hypothetical protein